MIKEVDIHTMTSAEAKKYINSLLNQSNHVDCIRIIHGYHQGNVLKNMIFKQYRTHPKVLRIEIGLNQGVTDLILKSSVK